MGRQWLVTSCVLAASAAAPAWAQPAVTGPPVIVIVESSDPRVEAGPIRAALATLTGRPVVALSSPEARGARALISFSVRADGGAHLLATTRDGAQALAASAPGEEGDDPMFRLSTAAAALLASVEGETERGASSIGLLPWGAVDGRGEGPMPAGAIGLLPWPGSGATESQPPMARRPMAERPVAGPPVTHPERAGGLSAPAPGR